MLHPDCMPHPHLVGLLVFSVDVWQVVQVSSAPCPLVLPSSVAALMICRIAACMCLRLAIVRRRSDDLPHCCMHAKASRSGDTFLFHGCSQESATNVQADGLKIRYASNGMLGRGLYGAPDPRKSEQFCKHSTNGKFMFVCRFNLKHAKHAGPSTEHRNTVFEEFCVYDEKHVVVLWMVKLRMG